MVASTRLLLQDGRERTLFSSCFVTNLLGSLVGVLESMIDWTRSGRRGEVHELEGIEVGHGEGCC